MLVVRGKLAVEGSKLTASSAQSVRLVVTLTEAGGTLGYTETQRSANWILFDQFDRWKRAGIFICIGSSIETGVRGRKRTHLGGVGWACGWMTVRKFSRCLAFLVDWFGNGKP